MNSRSAVPEYRPSKAEHWYLLRVRESFESVVCQALENRGIKAFLLESYDQKSRRKHHVLTGYVLCRIGFHDQESIMTLPGALCIAGAPKPIALDDEQVAELKPVAGLRVECCILALPKRFLADNLLELEKV